jgi:hypothetical protein
MRREAEGATHMLMDEPHCLLYFCLASKEHEDVTGGLARVDLHRHLSSH